MGGQLAWDGDGAAYILSRSARYPGVMDVRPEWTYDVLTDPDVLTAEPDPKSRIKAARFIGYSVGAGVVLTVVAWRDARGDLHGINAWKTSGAELRRYQEDR